MQIKNAAEKLIARTAQILSYPHAKHLCITCNRYIKGLCPVGMDITHGDRYEDVLIDLVSRQWEDKNTVPTFTIYITQCRRYKKEIHI